MIVDCHTHLHECPGHVSQAFATEAKARGGDGAMDLHVPPQRHWRAMESVGKAVVLGFRAFESGLVIPNEYIADYVRAHPEKLIGFASVDPAEDDARVMLEHAIKDLRLAGLKLAPIYQHIHPLDERMLPIYEFCQAHHVPILIHQGTTFLQAAPLAVALPILLEDVAMRFPDLKVVVAHLGQPWIVETLVLIRKQPNFFADVSALHYRPWQFYNALITAKEYGVLNKLLFGSDFPYTTAEATMAALRVFNQLTVGTHLPTLAAEEIEQLIHSPTLELLGLA
jgi:uncharacterized protein